MLCEAENNHSGKWNWGSAKEWRWAVLRFRGRSRLWGESQEKKRLPLSLSGVGLLFSEPVVLAFLHHLNWQFLQPQPTPTSGSLSAQISEWKAQPSRGSHDEWVASSCWGGWWEVRGMVIRQHFALSSLNLNLESTQSPGIPACLILLLPPRASATSSLPYCPSWGVKDGDCQRVKDEGDKWGKHSVFLPDSVTRQCSKTNGQELAHPSRPECLRHHEQGPGKSLAKLV